MCQTDFSCSCRPLTFETLIADPLTQEVMRSDGVSLEDLVAVLEQAMHQLVARESRAVMAALS